MFNAKKAVKISKTAFLTIKINLYNLYTKPKFEKIRYAHNILLNKCKSDINLKNMKFNLEEKREIYIKDIVNRKHHFLNIEELEVNSRLKICLSNGKIKKIVSYFRVLEKSNKINLIEEHILRYILVAFYSKLNLLDYKYNINKTYIEDQNNDFKEFYKKHTNVKNIQELESVSKDKLTSLSNLLVNLWKIKSNNVKPTIGTNFIHLLTNRLEEINKINKIKLVDRKLNIENIPNIAKKYYIANKNDIRDRNFDLNKFKSKNKDCNVIEKALNDKILDQINYEKACNLQNFIFIKLLDMIKIPIPLYLNIENINNTNITKSENLLEQFLKELSQELTKSLIDKKSIAKYEFIKIK